MGLVSDEAALRAQWRYWLDVEMAWLDRSATPLFNATGNHMTYDAMSARVFCEALAHLPGGGAPGQEGLSYALRWGELLMVFVHTLAAERGGKGHVEADWLRRTLEAHADARWRLVVGHHPVFPVNGYAGPHQRTICPEDAGPFWAALRNHGVTAYLCSHILAFDVQCHGGVLQITSAGAGRVHRMPEGVEYLHCVQMALDGMGLRLQVIDDEGWVRERLDWPPPEPGPMHPLGSDDPSPWADLATSQPIVLAFSGRAAPAGTAARQTLLCGADEDGSTPLWIGLTGPAQRLAVLLQPEAGRSPHLWLGPGVEAGAPFDLHLMLHPGMGPGGLLWRPAGQERWTSLDGASAWGLERLAWPERHRIGATPAGDLPFAGGSLAVGWSRCHDGGEQLEAAHLPPPVRQSSHPPSRRPAGLADGAARGHLRR